MKTKHCFVFALVCIAQACVSDREFNSDYVESRLEKKLKKSVNDKNDISLADGLTEEEAIRLALKNNPAFRAVLVDIQLSQAELIQARMLPNPLFSTNFPAGPKQFEFSLFIPFDVILLRPNRTEAAEVDCEQVGQSLVKNGLDLIRQVKQAYSNLELVRKRAKLFEDEANLRRRMARFDALRFETGEISESTAIQSKINSMDALRLINKNQNDVRLAEEAIRSLIGYGEDRTPIQFITSKISEIQKIPGEAVLFKAAVVGRPDLKASEFALKASGVRLELAEWDWLRYLGVLDVNDRKDKNGEVGPGLQFEIPVLNNGEGGKARTAANVEKLLRTRAMLKHQIAVEVRLALLNVNQAQSNYQFWRSKTLPEIQKAADLAEQEFQAGQISYLPVLESKRQVINAQLTQQQLLNQLQIAYADLEWSIGGQIPIESGKNN
ncbi:MAG: TolC family protein [Planctomycetota bacterium]|nr:TolC family protein [Planctomycetota bacterium]